MPARILMVDDDQSMCEACGSALRQHGFQVDWHVSPQAALEALRNGDFEAVLTDLNMPGMDGIELCRQIVANRPDVPVVVITAFGNLNTAVGAMRAGAYDFVTKPVEMELLALTLNRAVQHHELQEQIRLIGGATAGTDRFERLLGASEPMRILYDQLARIADTDASVLILGESGTGKELVAAALHSRSRRGDAPFVAVNCAAVPEALLESELFGHEQGAFTGAQKKRTGLILQANGGTLLLDEIAEVPPSLQPKLLRALESRLLRPVGSDREVPFDVRFLASTNRDLDSRVEDGLFREDLYFRLNVIQIDVPPLRARGMDILVLARHFLEESAARSKKELLGLSEAVAEKLLGYDWPGNVRELRNAIDRAVALARYSTLAVEDLPEKIRVHTSSQMSLGGSDPTELLSMDEVERRYVTHVMKAVQGNKTLAARTLGYNRKTLYRKLARYRLD
jgi:two-component system response regulator HydG